MELCSLLLASRYKGFLRGGVGPDGGVDAELDETLGVWHSESKDALLNEIIKPGQKVVFQFKHMVTGRIGGPTKARKHLLGMYKCRASDICGIHRVWVVQAKPDCYVLVTNVEVNSNFRAKFIKQCKSENPDIQRYQIVGLDELEAWVVLDVELRHLYFPTTFGLPRFNLAIRVSEGALLPYHGEDFGEPVSTVCVSAKHRSCPFVHQFGELQGNHRRRREARLVSGSRRRIAETDKSEIGRRSRAGTQTGLPFSF